MTGKAQWSQELRQAWEEASPSQRFTYRINRALVRLLVGLQIVIWGLFVVTAVAVHEWTILLTLFVLIYIPLTVYVVVTLLRWRAFCLMSGIVVGEMRLVWSQGTETYSVAMSGLNAERLGLEDLADSTNRLEAALSVDLDNGGRADLCIVKPHAFLDDLEGFMGLLLQAVHHEPAQSTGVETQTKGARKRRGKRR